MKIKVDKTLYILVHDLYDEGQDHTVQVICHKEDESVAIYSKWKDAVEYCRVLQERFPDVVYNILEV